jgi:hypothetical protein
MDRNVCSTLYFDKLYRAFLGEACRLSGILFCPHLIKKYVGRRDNDFSVGAHPSAARIRIILVAEPLGRRSKFNRDVGGPLVGGVDIMMSSDPRTVVHLACSPLLYYAFCVAKLRGCRT